MEYSTNMDLSNLWVYVGDVSEDAKEAVRHNKGTLVNICADPRLWIVHIPTVKYEEVQGAQVFWLPDNHLVYVERYMSDEESMLYRDDDSLLNEDYGMRIGLDKKAEFWCPNDGYPDGSW